MTFGVRIMQPIPTKSYSALIDLINETYTDEVDRILSAGVDDRDNIICLAQDGDKRLAIEITDINIKIKLYNPTAKFSQEPDTPDRIATNLQHIGDPIFGGWLGQIKQMLETSDDLESMRESLFQLYPDLDGTELTKQMTDAMAVASMAGFWDAGSEGDEAEFARIPEGTVRRRNGVDYVLEGSRWHRSDSQSNPKDRLPQNIRAAAIGDLVDKFEINLKQLEEQISNSKDINEVIELQRPEKIDAIGDRLISDLMDLTRREDAEAWAGEINGYPLQNKFTRTEAERNAADFYQLIGKNLGVKTIRYEDNRSYAKEFDRSIGLEDIGRVSNRKILFHEMGHFAEFNDNDNRAIASAWVKERATGEPRSLRQLTGIAYDQSEIAYPDRFIDHYVGKKYSNDTTEVHSMGLEQFSRGKDVVRLFQKDREHFDFIIRYIKQ
jgi:hypothetical protein